MSWREHCISSVNLSDTLHLTEIGPKSGDRGFWLYDDTQGMNLAMRATTREAALLEALRYYQTYLAKARAERNALHLQVIATAEHCQPDGDCEYELGDEIFVPATAEPERGE